MNAMPLEIEPGLYVVFEYTMKTETGEKVAGTEDDQPIGFIVGRRHMLPVVEGRLLGMKAGEKATFWLLPDEAFGASDPSKIRDVPRAGFPEGVELKVGMFFKPPGQQSPFPVTIVEVGEETIKVDMNHPLAGKKLRLDVNIHEVRPLTPHELDTLAGGDPLGPPIKA